METDIGAEILRLFQMLTPEKQLDAIRLCEMMLQNQKEGNSRVEVAV